MPESFVEKYGWMQYIGKDMGSRTGEPITEKDVRHYALGIDDPNPIYFDHEAAKKSKYGAMVATPGYLFFATQNASIEERVKDLTETGFARGSFLGIPEFPGTWDRGWVRGGDDFDFIKRAKVGDSVTVSWKIANIVEKQGKTGSIVIVTSDHVYKNQDGELLANHRLTMLGLPIPEEES